MHIELLTLFPEFFTTALQAGLMGKAQEKGILSFTFHNPRDFSLDRHGKVDDRPYGGGPGMVMAVQPLADCLQALPDPGRVLVFSPRGRCLDQGFCQELAKEECLTLVCGRYEGIDARLAQVVDYEEVSIGDFVLNGGESAALCLVESVGRLLPGFMGHEDSAGEESFSQGLLEYPHFTRPEVFWGQGVPEVLLSGNHKEISRWRREKSLAITLDSRPELLDNVQLSDSDLSFLRKCQRRRLGRNLFVALVHFPVLDREGKETCTSLTNLDIHDIARLCATYGLGGYFVCTPLEDQQVLAQELVEHWTTGEGKKTNPDRARALAEVNIVASLAAACLEIENTCGMVPWMVATSAREGHFSVQDLRQLLKNEPVLLVLGTGHGLAPDVLAACKGTLRSLRFLDSYNHLAVRSAAAIIVDRILGDFR